MVLPLHAVVLSIYGMVLSLHKNHTMY
jgi:hypothetical protein